MWTLIDLRGWIKKGQGIRWSLNSTYIFLRFRNLYIIVFYFVNTRNFHTIYLFGFITFIIALLFSRSNIMSRLYLSLCRRVLVEFDVVHCGHKFCWSSTYISLFSCLHHIVVADVVADGYVHIIFPMYIRFRFRAKPPTVDAAITVVPTNAYPIHQYIAMDTRGPLTKLCCLPVRLFKVSITMLI